jgi:hypothetical protein
MDETQILKIWSKRANNTEIPRIELVPSSDSFIASSGEIKRLYVELQPRYVPVTEEYYYNNKVAVTDLIKILYLLSLNMMIEPDLHNENVMMCNGHIVKIYFGETQVIPPTVNLKQWTREPEFTAAWEVGISEWADKLVSEVGTASRKHLLYAIQLFTMIDLAAEDGFIGSLLDTAACEELRQLRVVSNKYKDLGPPDDKLTEMINIGLKGHLESIEEKQFMAK